MTLYGWDASDFDWGRGPMDVAAAARDGITFLTHKLTEGRTNRHVHAGTVLTRGRDAGIPFLGGYHVVHTADVPGQVAFLLAYADQEVPWWRTHPGWFWQCDAERWATDFPPASAVKAFCDQLAARTGKTVLCYASKGQYGDTLAGLGRPLWNANYGSNTAGHYLGMYPGDTSARWAAYSGQTPVMLQYGSQLTIGTQTGCDANAFRGTVAQLRALINPTATPVQRGDRMIVMAHEKGSNVDWVGDGVFRYQVPDAAHRANALVVMGLQGNPAPASVEFNPGTLDALGPVVVSAPAGVPTQVAAPASLSDADRTLIAQQVAALILPTLSTSGAVVTDAVKAALREGTG